MALAAGSSLSVEFAIPRLVGAGLVNLLPGTTGGDVARVAAVGKKSAKGECSFAQQGRE